MKTISLWQPWASLLVNGIKKIETRHWQTLHRGPLLIHAAKTTQGLTMCSPEFWDGLGELPFGAIVGIVKLVDCVRTEELAGNIGWLESELGNFAPHRYGWITEEHQAFKSPIPYKGSQGFFEVSDRLVAANASR